MTQTMITPAGMATQDTRAGFQQAGSQVAGVAKARPETLEARVEKLDRLIYRLFKWVQHLDAALKEQEKAVAPTA